VATWNDYEGEFGLGQQCAVGFFAVIIGVLAVFFLNLPGLAAGDSRYLYMPFTGTGFVVDTHHILTAAHVIEDCKRVVVRQGSAQWRAQVTAIDDANDLGLLRTEVSFRRTAKFTNRQSLSVGEPVVRYGYVSGEARRVWSKGEVSSLSGYVSRGKGRDSHFFQYNARTESGNSGGPVLDQSGSVIGIVLNGYYGDNSAAKFTIAKHFLVSNGINYQTENTTGKLQPKEIAKNARKFTLEIGCPVGERGI